MTKVKLKIQRIEKAYGDLTDCQIVRVHLIDPVTGSYELVMDFWADLFGRKSWRFVSKAMKNSSLVLSNT